LEPPSPAPKLAAETTTWWQEQTPTGARSAAATPNQNLYYDRSNPGYRTLQKANQALKGFPILKHGELDWVTTLRRGMIQPLASLSDDSQMTILDRDILMKNTKLMPYVRFPHRAHTEWLACSSCHDQIFVSKAGANRTTMSAILGGKSCGVCHNKVAFSTLACGRCHNVPKE
jgi:c(7)-type cytochrome triheme protein